MAILRVKNQYGEWEEVPAIVGSPGKDGNDYVLTDADKQEIAAEVLAVLPDAESGINVKNVRDYGAAGDGVTDDTEAIAAAVAAIGDGETLYFPAGVYRVYNIDLKSNITVQGDGWSSVIKLLDSPNGSETGNCLNLLNVENIIVRDIKLDGNRWANGEYMQMSTGASHDNRLNGLHIRSASDIYVENVWMYNNGYHGVHMTYVTNAVFENCKATDNGFRPIHGHEQISNCRLSNCVCENNGLGLQGGSGAEHDSIYFFGVEHLTINGNVIRSNRHGCITVGSNQGETTADNIFPSGDITISGNVCECYEDLPELSAADSDTGVRKFPSMGIMLYGGDHILENVTVTGNTIRNAHMGILIYHQEIANNQETDIEANLNAAITGNTFLNCSYGIYAKDVSDVIVSGNQFRNMAAAWVYGKSLKRWTISGNNVYAPGIEKMCTLYSSQDVVIQNNTLIGNAENAIYVSAVCTDVVVANNTLYGFTSADPVINTNGYKSGNLYISASADSSVEAVKLSPYTNPGFVRPSLVNPNTTSVNWRYTTPAAITDADIKYELNSYTYIASDNPAEYDFSALNYAIVFLSGTDLTTAVGIATLENGVGDVSFSETCVKGATTNGWGYQISITAEKVRELFPTAAYVMMQVETPHSDPDNVIAGLKALNDGNAYVYRKKS